MVIQVIESGNGGPVRLPRWSYGYAAVRVGRTGQLQRGRLGACNRFELVRGARGAVQGAATTHIDISGERHRRSVGAGARLRCRLLGAVGWLGCSLVAARLVLVGGAPSARAAREGDALRAREAAWAEARAEALRAEADAEALRAPEPSHVLAHPRRVGCFVKAERPLRAHVVVGVVHGAMVALLAGVSGGGACGVRGAHKPAAPPHTPSVDTLGKARASVQECTECIEWSWERVCTVMRLYVVCV
jgi:hypothetical protein